jgi:flagellar biosynthesis protein FlhG
MIDQATELRKLVLQAMRENPAVTGPPPRLVALTGGKGGVGVTTLAVNLSVALAEQGARVVVVDANFYRSDVAALCGLTDHHNIADVLVAKRDIHEVMQRGPAGIQIVPGLTTQNGLREANEMALARLERQLAALGRHADVVVLDLGSAGAELTRRFCNAASDVLLATTPDNVAVMDAYACIKANFQEIIGSTLRLVVNLADSEEQTADVHHRIAKSCQKFLGTPIEVAYAVPSDEAVNVAAASAVPFVLGSPQSPAAQALQRLAASLLCSASPTQRRAA